MRSAHYANKEAKSLSSCLSRAALSSASFVALGGACSPSRGASPRRRFGGEGARSSPPSASGFQCLDLRLAYADLFVARTNVDLRVKNVGRFGSTRKYSGRLVLGSNKADYCFANKYSYYK